MGIIGVVAALTLPNLNSSTGDKEKVAKVKKIYSNLNDAMGRAIAVYGAYNTWNAEPERISARLTEFMKISKDCGSGSSAACFTPNIITPSGDYSLLTTLSHDFILADGTSISVKASSELNNKVYMKNSDYIILVDIDGSKKGPNSAGKDIFIFEIDNNTGEITPNGQSLLSNGGVNYLSCECFQNLSACTVWVIQYDNMDYLKCPDKLTDNNTSCK
ncbi:hypothetical protein IJ843_00855 [bacterium]|nr:hypothetical protein [bacterium]